MTRQLFLSFSFLFTVDWVGQPRQLQGLSARSQSVRSCVRPFLVEVSQTPSSPRCLFACLPCRVPSRFLHNRPLACVTIPVLRESKRNKVEGPSSMTTAPSTPKKQGRLKLNTPPSSPSPLLSSPAKTIEVWSRRSLLRRERELLSCTDCEPGIGSSLKFLAAGG